MAMLLLPKLRETAASMSKDGVVPHMSFLLSIAAWDVEADWLQLGQSIVQRCDDQSKWDNIKQYFFVKLALWYFIQGLVEREEKEEGKHVIINANCPGLCKTAMNPNFPFFIRLIMVVQYFLVGRTTEEGARTMVGATGLGQESMGKLWKNDEYIPPSKLMESDRGTELYHETWEEILGILREHVPLEESI